MNSTYYLALKDSVDGVLQLVLLEFWTSPSSSYEELNEVNSVCEAQLSM
jgi:hypothetical protein